MLGETKNAHLVNKSAEYNSFDDSLADKENIIAFTERKFCLPSLYWQRRLWKSLESRSEKQSIALRYERNVQSTHHHQTIRQVRH